MERDRDRVNAGPLPLLWRPGRATLARSATAGNCAERLNSANSHSPFWRGTAKCPAGAEAWGGVAVPSELAELSSELMLRPALTLQCFFFRCCCHDKSWRLGISPTLRKLRSRNRPAVGSGDQNVLARGFAVPVALLVRQRGGTRVARVCVRVTWLQGFWTCEKRSE